MPKATPKRIIRRPSVKENARIVAAAKADPDAQPLTKSQLAAMAPLKSVRGLRHSVTKKTRPTSKNAGITPRKRAKQGNLTRAAVPGRIAVVDEASLLTDLRSLIQAARQRVATVANATQTMLYLASDNYLDRRSG